MFVIKDLNHGLYYSSSNGLKINLVKLQSTEICLFSTKSLVETTLVSLRTSNFPNVLEIKEVELVEKIATSKLDHDDVLPLG